MKLHGVPERIVEGKDRWSDLTDLEKEVLINFRLACVLEGEAGQIKKIKAETAALREGNKACLVALRSSEDQLRAMFDENDPRHPDSPLFREAASRK